MPVTVIFETGFNRIPILPHFARVIDILSCGVKLDALATDGAEMTIARIDFPILELLEQTHCRDVMVVAGGMVPAEQPVRPRAESSPTKMLAGEELGFNTGGTVAGGEGNILIVSAR